MGGPGFSESRRGPDESRRGPGFSEGHRGPDFSEGRRGPDFSEGHRGQDYSEGRRGNYERVRLYIGLGRRAGVRPQDLVGAITNEAGINGRAIGAIEIAERFSLVEVPAAIAGEIAEVLRNTRIKGHRPVVRPEHEER